MQRTSTQRLWTLETLIIILFCFADTKEPIFRKRLTEEKPRITCIECGSSDVQSRGLEWCCKSCGRRFLKNPKEKEKIPREFSVVVDVSFQGSRL